jgi:hypothetical protein
MIDDPLDIELTGFGRLTFETRFREIAKLFDPDSILLMGQSQAITLSRPVYGGRNGLVTLMFEKGQLIKVQIDFDPFRDEQREEFATFVGQLRRVFEGKHGMADPDEFATADRDDPASNGMDLWTRPAYTINIYWECPNCIMVSFERKGR